MLHQRRLLYQPSVNSETLPLLLASSKRDGKNDKKQTWPTIYWVVLKVLCLLHGRKVVSTRKCLHCRLRRLEREREGTGNTGPLPNYLFPTAILSSAGWWKDDDEDRGQVLDGNLNEVLEEERNESCDVCSSMWWNGEGNIQVYEERDIGGGCWNHRGSIYLSLVLLLVCFGFLSREFITQMIQFWGEEDHLMQFISYSSFLLTISTVPVFCLLANLRNIVPRTRVGNFDWTLALHPKFIVKRLQYLRPESLGAINKLFLIVCIVWPLFNSLYRACIYYLIVKWHRLDVLCSLLTCGIAGQIWGCFCYLLILLRTSIRAQLNLDIEFLDSHRGKVDVCRQRLGVSIHEFGSLCNLCATWMVLTMSMLSIGFATHVSWNYRLYSGKINVTPLVLHLNLMIWSEIIMFSSLSLLAVRGFDLHRIWDDFLMRISEIRCDKYHGFWEKIVKFVRQEFNPMTNVVKLTLLFSVISVYMALKMDNQSTNYWGGGQINATNVVRH